MDQKIVKVDGLWHRYGSDWAIQDIGFEISQFGVLGLLGSNGAGKSTTMNILCGVLNQTRGTVHVGGFDMRKQPVEAKKLIGFLPQNAPLYLDFTVQEYLTQCAFLRLIDKKDVSGAVDRAMEKCGVSHFRNRLISNLSGGYRQRVGIAQAIIHEPQLVVLDEPTNGLDPNQISAVRSLIKDIGKEKAVIFSSHILSEVQATCSHVKMIERGKMVFDDSMYAFNNYIKPTTLLVQMHQPPSVELVKQIEGVTDVDLLDGDVFRIHFKEQGNIAERIISKSMEEGWRIFDITHEKSSLDQIFAQLSMKNHES